MAGLSGTGGSRKIPTFSRPGTSITTGKPKRSWKQVPVTGIRAGDTIADYGLVHEVRKEQYRVKIWAGERDYFVSFSAEVAVMAFTEDRQ